MRFVVMDEESITGATGRASGVPASIPPPSQHKDEEGQGGRTRGEEVEFQACLRIGVESNVGVDGNCSPM